MLKSKILLVALFLVSVVSSCKDDSYDPDKQAQTDDELIVNFIATNKIAAQKDPSGLYFQIITPGTGNAATIANSVSVNYDGKLLNGTRFDSSSAPVSFPLANLIKGWQIGIPKIKTGGKIRLLVPSALGYGNNAQGAIPANSVLDFTIELINVQ